MELVPYSSPKSNPNNPSWSEMFRSASLRRPSPTPSPLPPPRQPESSPAADPPKPSATDAGGSLVGDPHARLALYIAMAHAGLALSLLLYDLYRLLHDFLCPGFSSAPSPFASCRTPSSPQGEYMEDISSDVLLHDFKPILCIGLYMWGNKSKGYSFNTRTLSMRMYRKDTSLRCSVYMNVVYDRETLV